MVAYWSKANSDPATAHRDALKCVFVSAFSADLNWQLTKKPFRPETFLRNHLYLDCSGKPQPRFTTPSFVPVLHSARLAELPILREQELLQRGSLCTVPMSRLNAAQETGQGLASHISVAYSAMVRSDENLPEAATFKIDLRVQASGASYNLMSFSSASR